MRSCRFRFGDSAVSLVILASIAGTLVSATACEEEYTECNEDRAPADFPPPEDRSAQCEAVCSHMEAIGCRLGCPFMPDAGPDADPTSIETSSFDCWTSCMAGVSSRPDVADIDVTRALRCYAGTETCRQLGACTRLCALDGGAVWPDELLCTSTTEGQPDAR